MIKVTYEEFLELKPCWLYDEREEKLERIGKRRKYWTAIDVLKLKDVSAEDKFWAVLREEFLEENIMHEFACQCAERALAKIENPDPRSIAAIVSKRAWLKGEITDDELKLASRAAIDAASEARDAARNVAYAYRDAATAASCAASYAASSAARYAAINAASAAVEVSHDERQAQVELLIKLLESEA